MLLLLLLLLLLMVLIMILLCTLTPLKLLITYTVPKRLILARNVYSCSNHCRTRHSMLPPAHAQNSLWISCDYSSSPPLCNGIQWPHGNSDSCRMEQTSLTSHIQIDMRLQKLTSGRMSDERQACHILWSMACIPCTLHRTERKDCF